MSKTSKNALAPTTMIRRWTVGILGATVWVALMSSSPNVLADKRICTMEDAQSAEDVAATANSWARLHHYFERYSHCDDGAIAEGFSESVSQLLADQWRDIRQLDELVRSQSSFREFVLRHIDESPPAERLVRIGENARARCPQDLEGLCRMIERGVRHVLPLVHQ